MEDVKVLEEMIDETNETFDEVEKHRLFTMLISKCAKMGVEFGFDNVFDKYKWREVAMGSILGHTVFAGASGGRHIETYGADALEADGAKAEYKTCTESDNWVEKIKKRRHYRVTMVYNGAYKDEAIDAYADVKHYVGVFTNTGRCVAIALVDTDYVVKTLRHNHVNRKPGTTTNCNGVAVDFDIDGKNPLIEIVYLADDLK